MFSDIYISLESPFWYILANCYDFLSSSMTITVGPYASTESSMYQIFNTDFKAHNKRDGVEDKLKSEKCSYLEPDTQNDPCSHPIVKEVLLTNHLNELRLQDEKHIRKKKSVLQQEKTYRTMKMRKKLKQLMSNIAETLNDIDQYFGADQLYGKINDQVRFNCS